MKGMQYSLLIAALTSLTCVTEAQTVSFTISGGCVGSPLTVHSDMPLQRIDWDNTSSVLSSAKVAWEKSATVVAGDAGCSSGSGAAYLNNPTGIFVDHDTVYIADQANQRIQKWAPGASSGVTVAGVTGSWGIASNQLNFPTDVFLDKDRNMFISDQYNKRIQKWAPGASSGTTVAGSSTGTGGSTASLLNVPHSVFVNGNDSVYITDVNNQRVQLWASGASSGVRVAGTLGSGFTPDFFDEPYGIWVDNSQTIFVADHAYHRITKWTKGSTHGQNVAGDATCTAGITADKLYMPTDVVTDESGNVYIADMGNHRIQRWGPGASVGETIAGSQIGSTGTADSLFNHQTSLFFDSAWNLFVCDAGNNRILKFQDTINTSYTPTSPGTYRATVYTFDGQVVTKLITVVSNSTPTVNIYSSPSVPKPGKSVTYTTSVSHAGTAPTFVWRKNGVPIAGATSSSYNLTSATLGDVISVTMHSNEDCTSPDSATASAAPVTGLEKIRYASDKVLYPNPNNGQFNLVMQLAIGRNDAAIIQVTNMLGEVVYNSSVAVVNGWVNKTIELNGNIPDGIYILRLSANGDVKNIQFTIAH